MKKDIEWLKEGVNKALRDKVSDGINYYDYIDLKNSLNELINQLDEPEVLSQEWIDEHTYHEDEYDFYYADPDELKNLLVPKQEITYEDALKVIAENIGTDEFSIGLYLEALNNNVKYKFLTEKWIEDNTSPVDDEGRLYVWKRDLQNVLIPKESLGNSQKLEKVQIPKFVADVIEAYKSNSILTDLLADLAFHGGLAEFVEHEDGDEVLEWARSNRKATDEILARAWLYGYEVAEEQKYYVVKSKGLDGVYYYFTKFDDEVCGLFGLPNDKEVAYKFDDKEKAQAIANYTNSEVEELEE